MTSPIHHSVWRFVSVDSEGKPDPDGDDIVELEVCAVCHSKHEDRQTPWPCEFAS